MDALFVVVAELLIVPLILWGLVVVELTVGVVTSIASVMLGRRTLGDAVVHRFKSIRRRLVWGLLFFTGGLILADLVFFEALVNLALREVDERGDLQLEFAHAEGSFMLGRIELHQLHLSGTRGGDDPTAQFAVTIETLVIDIDTAALLSADFAVEEIALDGIVGSFDRVRVAAPEQPREVPSFELSREFRVERMHVGQMQLELRDQTRAPARELAVRIDELDIGPLRSETALFDLLYRARGHGSVAGLGFTLTAVERGGQAQTTLEVRDLPLDALGDQLEKTAGVRARGHADLQIVDTYSDGPPEPKVELAVALKLRELELEAGEGASASTRLMLGVAGRALTQLGGEFPVSFEVTFLRSELEGMRNLSEAGVAERISEGIGAALRDTLRRADAPKPEPTPEPTPEKD